MPKTKICTSCFEELEATRENFYRINRSSEKLRSRCIGCEKLAKFHVGVWARLPRIKVKAANILFACGYDYSYIAKDMGATERAVRNSISVEAKRA